MSRLILIRHGLTDWNLEKRYNGFLDAPLNVEGRRQAHKLRRRLKNISIDKVYSSDRSRAVKSAQLVFPAQPIKKVPALREINFGIFEGLTYKEIMARYRRLYRRWLKDPLRTFIPEGENPKTFRKRVLQAFKKIIADNADKTIAVVSHGGVISIFINSILKTKDFWRQIPHLASVSIVECQNDKRQIKLFNDTAHLYE